MSTEGWQAWRARGREQYVIARGTITEGFRAIGPFATWEIARKWREANGEPGDSLVALVPPMSVAKRPVIIEGGKQP